MAIKRIFLILVALVGAGGALHSMAAEKQPYTGTSCTAPKDEYFVNEVWPTIGATKCLQCHKDGGEAEESEFILLDPTRFQGAELEKTHRHNREQFAAMARRKRGDESRILLKAVGALKHGGKEILKPGSPGYQILAKFVQRLDHPPDSAIAQRMAQEKNAPPFFDGVVMLDDRRLLRRATLSLAGRLPTDAELKMLVAKGSKAIPELLDAVMKEDAFYGRLREAFNDIFLTHGIDGTAEATILAYEHFEKSRLWYQKYDVSSAGDQKAQTQARYKLSNDYRKALLGEPMKLVEHIVRNDRPFTEIVTADYWMVTPYSARGYGCYDQVKDQFKDPEDPFEYVPVKLKALKGRSRESDQESATGFYPHAGILGSFQWLTRYPTTETNRNRLRSRMYYQHFLGVDVLELAARVSDAAAVTAKYPIPTMQASECVVCHTTLDPVASCFQDYWRFADIGVYGKRKGGWFTDMFQAGYEGEDLPSAERWRALQWLGERTVKDPRFAVAMVEHAYYMLTGRKALLAPKDLEDPLFVAKRRAYQEQRKVVEAIALRFSQNGFNFKTVLKDWIQSDFYRADGLATVAANPQRRAELDDIGVEHMLSPEQLERKLGAIFERPWNRLQDQMAMLYGGIDSKEVTERAADPSGAMGAIQRIMANDVAMRNTAFDFSREPAERILFADVEPDVVPGTPDADAKIRKTIVHLHERILGRIEAANSPEVDRTYRLFAGVVADAAGRKFDKEEIYSARQGLKKPIADPKYTIRAWRAVVTYLLRRHEFLYE
jgi:hypothetical protein